MLSKKIIASSITNLTDARYFAGWMIDYLHFDLRPSSPNQVSIQQVGEFISWIEGPQILLSVDENIDLELLKNLPVVGIVKNQQTQYRGLQVTEVNQYSEQGAGEVMALLVDTIDDKFKNLDIDVFFDINASDEWVNADWIEGLVVYGGPEEKVGLKSFDDLDEIFENLSEWD